MYLNMLLSVSIRVVAEVHNAQFWLFWHQYKYHEFIRTTRPKIVTLVCGRKGLIEYLQYPNNLFLGLSHPHPSSLHRSLEFKSPTNWHAGNNQGGHPVIMPMPLLANERSSRSTIKALLSPYCLGGAGCAEVFGIASRNMDGGPWMPRTRIPVPKRYGFNFLCEACKRSKQRI